MSARVERRTARLGGAEVELSPLEPWQWEPLADTASGPASLCLELLALAGPSWHGVVDRAGKLARPDPAVLESLPAGAAGVLLPLLRASWLDPAQTEALAGLERHLEARADYPGLDCAACDGQERAGEGEPDCAACPLPPLPALGLEALRLAVLLRGAPRGAAALLPGLLAGRPPGHLRLLLSALEMIARRWGAREALSGRGPGGVLE